MGAGQHRGEAAGAIYRRPCLDFDDLCNPVQLWRAGGGRLHPSRRRRIQPPAEVLPRWHRGFETAVRNPVVRDAFRFGLYTGMRLTEVSRSPGRRSTWPP